MRGTCVNSGQEALRKSLNDGVTGDIQTVESPSACTQSEQGWSSSQLVVARGTSKAQTLVLKPPRPCAC